MLTTPEAETDTAPAPLYEIHIANVTAMSEAWALDTYPLPSIPGDSTRKLALASLRPDGILPAIRQTRPYPHNTGMGAADLGASPRIQPDPPLDGVGHLRLALRHRFSGHGKQHRQSGSRGKLPIP